MEFERFKRNLLVFVLRNKYTLRQVIGGDLCLLHPLEMSQTRISKKFTYCFLIILIRQQYALLKPNTFSCKDTKSQSFSKICKWNLEAAFDNSLEVSEEGPQFTRGNQMNYAALWQEKGEYYLSPDRLRELNRQLLKAGQPQGAEQKKSLVDELSVTYFARHHNVIREEYQYEKAIVEDRLKTWSLKRLQKEGVTLVNLNADMKGSLYQDSVIRFHLRDFVPLPVHKFIAGDSVRITNSRIVQSSANEETFIEGIVIDKRTKFLDIAVRSSEAQSAFFTGGPVYRLDAFVNRVTYDRMIEALQSFLPGKTLSSTLRDLILYSYPNSMLRLSNSPGGLKLALPLIDEEDSVSDGSSNIGRQNIAASVSGRNGDNENNEGDDSNSSQGIASSSTSSFSGSSSTDSSNRNMEEEKRGNDDDSPGVMTLGSSLSKLIAQSSQAQRPKKNFQFVKSSPIAGEEGELAGSAASSSTSTRTVSSQAASKSTLPGIFRVSNRLHSMSENFPKASRKAALFTAEEVRDVVQELSVNRPLNPSQQLAVEAALLRPLSLCQGPPGTGKTRTACFILATLVHLKDLRCRAGGEVAKGIQNTRILASAHSNIATDNLLEGLATLNVSVVRLGRPVNIRSSLWNYTLDAKIQNLPAYQNLSISLQNATMRYEALKGRAAELNQELTDVDKRDLRATLTEVQTLKKVIIENENKFANEVLMNTDVIVSTCVGAGASTLKTFLREFPFIEIDTVLVDEAAQCMEAASLIPLSYGCRRLILIGDQNQLPPVVAAPEALENGLGVSLFSRLVAGGLAPQLLTEQYRMHPKIAQFPSQQFYSNRVLSRVSTSSRPTPTGILWPNHSVPVLFVNLSPINPIAKSAPVSVADSFNALLSDEEALGVSMPISGGFEQQSNATQLSFYNSIEAEAVVEVVSQLLADGQRTFDSIGVISPYSAQVRILTDMFKERGWINAGMVNDLSESDGVMKGASDALFESDKARRIRISTILNNTDKKKKSREEVEKKKMNAKLSSEGLTAVNTPSISELESREVLTAASIQKLKADFIRKFEEESSVILQDNIDSCDESGNDKSMDDGDEILAAFDELDSSEKSNGMSSSGSLLGTSPSVFSDSYRTYRANDDDDDEESEDQSALRDRILDQAGITSDQTPKEDIVDESTLEVRSVDGFQGREKDVIVISAVRSNRQGRLGFLKDWRRLNVAITRARSGLIVVGDFNTLIHDSNWKAFIDWCKNEGCFIDGDVNLDHLTKHYFQSGVVYKDKFVSNTSQYNEKK